MLYTKKGDGGFSENALNVKYSKDYILFELLGTLDELSSAMGVAKTKASFLVKDVLSAYQKEIIILNGVIAGKGSFDTDAAVERTQTLIDAYSKKIPPFTGFVLSGDTEAGAHLDVARTIARRAERIAVKASKLFVLGKETLPYFNRISDLLYVLARYEDSLNTKSEESPSYKIDKSTMPMNLERAEEICKIIMEKAREIGVLSVCAVCDSGGNLICLKRDDNAYIASINVATNKAYTSVSLKMPTKNLENLTKPGDPLYGIQHQDPKIVVFGGGIPIYDNGMIVGGFGVSGGSLEQDVYLADYADELFNK